jgi:hypothetical protein
MFDSLFLRSFTSRQTKDDLSTYHLSYSPKTHIIKIVFIFIVSLLCSCTALRRLEGNQSNLPPLFHLKSFLTPPNTVILPEHLRYLIDFQDPPLLDSSRLLGRVNLKTAYYTIHPSAKNDGLMNHYLVTSPLGNGQPIGRVSLLIMLDELRALKQIESISTSQVVYESLTDQVLGLLTAPIRALIYAGKVILNPNRLFDTASRVPSGAEKLGGTIKQKISGGQESVSAVVREAEEEVGGDSLFDTSVRLISRTGQRFLGYRRRYSKWLIKLRVDPNTRNQSLLNKISELAWLETGIDFGFNFVPGLPGIATVGTFNRYHRRAQQLAEYDDDGVLESKMWKELTRLEITGEPRRVFFKHPAYSATNRLRIIESLKLMPDIQNREHLITIANQARTDAQAFFYATVAEQLTDINRKISPIIKMINEVMIPTVQLANGVIVIVLPVDHIAWTRDNALIFTDFISRFKKFDVNDNKILIYTTGNLSTLAKKNLNELNFEIKQALNGNSTNYYDVLPIPEIVNFEILVDGNKKQNILHPRIEEILPDL